MDEFDERARTMAIEGLDWLAGQADALGQFLAQSGLAVHEIRPRADDPAFLAAVLDFIAGEEARARDFCATVRIRPEDLHRARQVLGGATPDWT